MFMPFLNQEGGAKVGLPSFFWVFGSPKLSPDKIRSCQNRQYFLPSGRRFDIEISHMSVSICLASIRTQILF
ncbi:unnamed protein product [Meloidogyne enterolobii]|uniref:Uncharacterized protein n=1 Tax=Meloidogyne enterolobii TaxID=390850 RepID=A0ACB1AT07_MELEN